MSLTVETQERDGVVVVAITGDLDMATAPVLQHRLTDLFEAGATRVVFDLAKVGFCDSTGLSVFVRARNHCDAANGYLRIAAPTRGVRRILEVSGLVEVLPTFDTLPDALAADATAPATE